MDSLTLLFIIFIIFIILAASGPRAAESSQVQRRYFFYYDAKTREDALAVCRDKHTDLATITSMEDVVTLRNMADLSRMVNQDYSHRAWIGLYDDVDSWRWSLSDPSFYADGGADFRWWLPGQPDGFHSEEHCALMFDDGGWNDAPCSLNVPPVCCDVTGPDVTFVLIPTPMSWTEAQSYCRERHTDLASVRTGLENQEVRQLVGPGQRVWIGLSRESWKWSDGSKSSFRFWSPGIAEPNNLATNETCAAADFNNRGEWEDWTCEGRRSYICQSLGITKQVMRVRVQKKKNPSVDLNHAAVKGHILQQLHLQLKEEGLHENIGLSWRKQSDGNVFQKEEDGATC